MKINKDKCKALQLRRNNRRHQHVLEGDWLETSSAGKDLRVLMNNKLITKQQQLTAKATNSFLACIMKSTASMWREVIFSLNTTSVRPHLEYCA